MRFSFAATALLLAVSQTPAAEPKLELHKGDRIAYIGNALPDRMQHDGWLEAYLAARFPDRNLSVRNLGVCGDELTYRMRSANFGTPEDWLRRVQADVVFAFFGYNESFSDPGKFRRDLEAFVDATTGATYGKAKARLVLFSPIAHESRDDPNWPPARDNNARLERTTDIVAEVAKAKGVVYVDLFHPTRELYAKAQTPLTINGIHLTPAGNRAVAAVIDRALFGESPAPAAGKLDAIHAAVVDKNGYWWNRYRVVDGYNVYGGRSSLAYNGQTNKVVMDREMEVLDVMTANRDKVIWAAARGQTLKPDDSNTPPFLETLTNKPGPLPGGKHVFLEAHEAIAKMTVAPGLKVNLFADERRFPDLVNPVQMNFDNAGRLWVATWKTYPHWKPKETAFDKLVVFEDTDGDGVADKSTNFADGLHCPTGFEFWNGGVLVACQPELLFLKDTDGDGKADFRQVVLQGIDSADTHHAANSFVYDGGMALYFQEGTFHQTHIETPYGPPVRCKNAGVFRFEPRTAKVDLYVNFGFANPHGHVFDRWGQDIVIDGTGAQPYHAALFSGQTADENHKHSGPPQVYKQRTRPCPGAEILSSRHFPESMQGNMLVGNVIGVQGILQYKFHDKGASFGATEVEPIVYSSDPNFRPADIKIGPDGAIYFTDWHNPIIGHMQHHIRDPNRDRDHGRVYRVTCEGRPLLKPAKVVGAPVADLLKLLHEPEDRVRYAARRELAGRDAKEVLAAAETWAKALDAKDPNYEHDRLEHLWLHQNLNVVDDDLLKAVLRSPDFRARAAATRVLCYWRDRVSQPLDLLQVQINDPHPRVRLEAIRALSFFDDARALEIAVELLGHPTDQYLTYTFNETLATLELRAVAGARATKRNIAAALVKVLNGTMLDADRQVALLDNVCKYGGPAELQVVWRKAFDARGNPPAVRAKALDGLIEAALNRKARPQAIAADEVKTLVHNAPPALLPAALRLVVAWKVREAANELARVAKDAAAPLAARYAAMDGLAAFAGPDNAVALLDLANDPNPMAVRFHAAAALAAIDLPAAASAAAKALVSAGEADDAGPLVQAFLARRGGSDALAREVEAKKLSVDAAKRVLRAMYLAGRNDAALANAASKLAGLDADPKPPTPAEVRTLIAQIAAKGDAARGEAVFRRADLGCVKCHAINKAGGNVGPDLGPLGASSPAEYVVTSILDPNAAIKEEYLTKVIATKAGRVVTGIVVRRDKNVAVLKDATGAVVRIPAAEIESEEAGKSLMPEGITRILTRGELLDLMRFISELGKGAYAPSKTPTVQRWRRLVKTGPALSEGVPNREAVRELLVAPADAWEPVFARVDGTLPLGELPAGVTYLQGDINVTMPGDVTLALSPTAGATVWVDEEPLDLAKGRMRLEAGRHMVTVRVAASKSAALKLAVGVPTGSASRVEVVAGGE